MAIDKKLIHFKTWNTFISNTGVNGNYTTPSTSATSSSPALYGQIKETSIVFIQDVQKIWTHGKLYDCSTPDLSAYLTAEDLATLNAFMNNSSVSKNGETLTVKINNSTQSLTNTWRSISDKTDGTSSAISASEKAVAAAYSLAASKTSNTGTVTSVTPGTGLTGASSDAAITTSGTINLKTAEISEIGGIKVASVGATASGANTTVNANKFAVHVDSNGLGYVAIPAYTNNSGDITGVTAGDGLTGGATSGNATLNVGAGTGIIVAADSVSVNLNDTTSLGTIGTTSKLYAVGVDANGKLAVNVPWTDTDTDTKVTSVGNHYTPTENTSAAISASGGANANITGTTGKLNVVTGLKRDAKGHIVGVTSANIYSTDNNDNTAHAHTVGIGLAISGSGGTSGTTTYSANLKDATALTIDAAAATTTSGRVYPVAVDKSGYLAVNVPWKNDDTKSFTITANANDDDVVVLSGTNGTNATTYTASHAKTFGNTTAPYTAKYTSGNSTTSISGYGASATIKIPQITVDEYGHVRAGADESVTITMPSAQTIPTLSGGASAETGKYVSGVTVSGHAVTVTKGTLPTIPTTLKNPESLSFGSKSYDGSSAQTITAADLGLDSALKFHGTSKTAITDGSQTQTVTLSDNTQHTAENGCVLFYGNKEFVWNGSSWEELGNEGDYKVKQTAVSSPSASGSTSAFIDTISQDINGVITVTKKNLAAATTTVIGGLKLYNTAKTTAISPNAATTTSGRYYAVELDKDGKAFVNVPWTDTDTNTDTKNTAGTTNNTGTKLYLAGATTQAANPQTYSNSNCYIGTDNCLYSNGTKVLTSYTNTTYDAGAGLSLSGTTFSHADTNTNISADTSYGPAANVTQSAKNTATFKVPQITLDQFGHVKSVTERTITVTDTDTDTNTHYTSKNIVGSSSTATSNGAVTGTGGVYLNHLEESTVKSTHNIVGAGSVKVTSDSSGNITITGTDTDTSTTYDGHYTPSANTNSELTASLSGNAGAYAKDTEYTVLTGVKAQRDAKGHVVGLTYTAQKIKDTNTDTNTHWTTRLYAGASGTAANAVASNPYLKVTDDDTYRNQVRFVGSGTVSVASDANGNITITGSAHPTSLPASDVYAWAKASSKPTYTKSEVGLGNVDNTADSAKSVKSAAQLTTARTIWGQSFNGTGNVSGSMTGVSDITMSGNIKMGDATISYDSTQKCIKFSF